MNYAKIEMGVVKLKRNGKYIPADCIYRQDSWCGEACPCVKEDESYVCFCKGLLKKEVK